MVLSGKEDARDSNITEVVRELLSMVEDIAEEMHITCNAQDSDSDSDYSYSLSSPPSSLMCNYQPPEELNEGVTPINGEEAKNDGQVNGELVADTKENDIFVTDMPTECEEKAFDFPADDETFTSKAGT